MTTYKAPIKDFQFLYQTVFKADVCLNNLDSFAALDNDVFAMVLKEGAKVCEEILHPINASGDLQGCQFEDGKVTTPIGFTSAYQTYTESGWSSLSLPEEYGGQGLPETLNFLLAHDSGFQAYVREKSFEHRRDQLNHIMGLITGFLVRMMMADI